MVDPEDALDLAGAAATLRANSADVQVLLRTLVTALSDALGERITTTSARGHWRHADALAGVRVRVGADQFEATVEGTSLHCVVGRVSGGIRIRSEVLETDEWTTRLVSALGEEAARSESSRQALERLIIGGEP